MITPKALDQVNNIIPILCDHAGKDSSASEWTEELFSIVGKNDSNALILFCETKKKLITPGELSIGLDKLLNLLKNVTDSRPQPTDLDETGDYDDIEEESNPLEIFSPSINPQSSVSVKRKREPESDLSDSSSSKKLFTATTDSHRSSNMPAPLVLNEITNAKADTKPSVSELLAQFGLIPTQNSENSNVDADAITDQQKNQLWQLILSSPLNSYRHREVFLGYISSHIAEGQSSALLAVIESYSADISCDELTQFCSAVTEIIVPGYANNFNALKDKLMHDLGTVLEEDDSEHTGNAADEIVKELTQRNCSISYLRQIFAKFELKEMPDYNILLKPKKLLDEFKLKELLQLEIFLKQQQKIISTAKLAESESKRNQELIFKNRQNLRNLDKAIRELLTALSLDPKYLREFTGTEDPNNPLNIVKLALRNVVEKLNQIQDGIFFIPQLIKLQLILRELQDSMHELPFLLEAGERNAYGIQASAAFTNAAGKLEQDVELIAIIDQEPLKSVDPDFEKFWNSREINRLLDAINQFKATDDCSQLETAIDAVGKLLHPKKSLLEEAETQSNVPTANHLELQKLLNSLNKPLDDFKTCVGSLCYDLHSEDWDSLTHSFSADFLQILRQFFPMQTDYSALSVIDFAQLEQEIIRHRDYSLGLSSLSPQFQDYCKQAISAIDNFRGTASEIQRNFAEMQEKTRRHTQYVGRPSYF